MMQVLPLLVPQAFVDQFVFIWGCEQCIRTLGELTIGTYYYLKDLNHVCFVCQRLHYGIEDQMLFIDNEPSKVLQNSKCSGLYVEFSKGHQLSKNKVQWLDVTSCLWLVLVELPLVKTIGVHYTIIVQYSKPHVDFFFAKLFLVHVIYEN